MARLTEGPLSAFQKWGGVPVKGADFCHHFVAFLPRLWKSELLSQHPVHGGDGSHRHGQGRLSEHRCRHAGPIRLPVPVCGSFSVLCGRRAVGQGCLRVNRNLEMTGGGILVCLCILQLRLQSGAGFQAFPPRASKSWPLHCRRVPLPATGHGAARGPELRHLRLLP